MIASQHIVVLPSGERDFVRRRSTPGLVPDAIQMALADPIKVCAAWIFCWSTVTLWGPSERRNEPDERFPRPHEWQEQASGDRVCARCQKRPRVPEGPTADSVCSYLTPREALQRLGTEGARVLYPDTWVDLLIRNADCAGLVPLIVVSDVRFPNEARAIRKAGGVIWQIVRPGAGLAGAAGQHASEAGVPDDLIDHTIKNDGTLADLEASIRGALKELNL